MLRKSLVIALLSLAASLVSFASQIALAHAFGASLVLDAYLIASSVPVVLAGLLGASMSFALLPALTRAAGDAAGFSRLVRRVLLHVTALVAVFVLIGWLTAGLAVRQLGNSLTAELAMQAVLLVQLSWLANGALLLAGFLGLVLNAQKHFFLPVIASASPHLFTLPGIVFLADELGPAIVPAALLAGATAALLWLLLRARQYLRQHGAAAPADLRSAYRDLPAAILAMGCFSCYPLIDALLAPPLGPGVLSTFGYAERLLIAIGNLVIAGPAALLVAHLHQLAGGVDRHEARLGLLRVVRVAIAGAAGIALPLSLLALPLVALLFQRGAFSAGDTAQLAAVLQIMLAGMPAMTGCVLLFRGLFQLGEAALAALLGLAWPLLYSLLGLFMSAQAGAPGLAQAYTWSWWLVFAAALLAASWPVLRRQLWPWSALGLVVAGSLLAANAAAAALRLAQRAYPQDLQGLLALAIAGGLVFAVYAAACLALLRLPLFAAAVPWRGGNAGGAHG